MAEYCYLDWHTIGYFSTTAVLLVFLLIYRVALKVVIKIAQGSVVTQTMLGGLTIYPPVANFL